MTKTKKVTADLHQNIEEILKYPSLFRAVLVCIMSGKGSPQEQKSGREIPVRRITDISNIPSDYSTTPGGSIFSTTPGGNYHMSSLSHYFTGMQIPQDCFVNSIAKLSYGICASVVQTKRVKNCM